MAWYLITHGDTLLSKHGYSIKKVWPRFLSYIHFDVLKGCYTRWDTILSKYCYYIKRVCVFQLPSYIHFYVLKGCYTNWGKSINYTAPRKITTATMFWLVFRTCQAPLSARTPTSLWAALGFLISSRQTLEQHLYLGTAYFSFQYTYCWPQS